MVKYSDDELDSVFAALADPTRRAVLNTLAGHGVASPKGVSVTELAAPHGMSLPGFMKHLRVLEDAGLIAREKEGRVVSCELSAAPMKTASAWMSRYEKFWSDKPESLARWWGPGGGGAVSVAEVDLRVGGRFRMVFGGPQGKEHESLGIYKEV